jgi:hypothetical protein
MNQLKIGVSAGCCIPTTIGSNIYGSHCNSLLVIETIIWCAVLTTPADREGARVDYLPTRAAFPK